MWHKNSKGPSTVPCGTPESTVVASEEVPSITSYLFMSQESGQPLVEISRNAVVVQFV